MSALYPSMTPDLRYDLVFGLLFGYLVLLKLQIFVIFVYKCKGFKTPKSPPLTSSLRIAAEP